MKLFAPVLLFTVCTLGAACKSSSPAAEETSPGVSSPQGSTASPAQVSSSGVPRSAVPQYLGSQLPSAFQTMTLTDPILHMKAYDVTIPAGWKFDGTVAQGTQCKTIPFPVFRAYSPDGLSEFRREPRLDWASSNNAKAAQAAAQCPQLSTSITAADFLRYFAGANGAQWVADWPLSPSDLNSFRASIQQGNTNYQRSNMRGYSMTGDEAAARTLIQNGSFQVEQQLLVAIVCNQTPLPDGSSVTGCTAQVRALRAPKGQLDALVALIGGHPGSGAVENPAWDQALAQAAAARNQQIMEQRAAAFQQWSNMMAQEHSQFMAQMSAEGAARSAVFENQQAAKSTAASDWVDYALNQQTVSGSGGVQKVSSSFGITWSNGQGLNYQTNDPSANPNGVLAGTWTQQQVVHGNGQP